MAADGRIVIDVLLDDDSVARGVGDINGQFDDLDRNGNSRLAKVGSGIKKVASIAAIGATAVVGIGAAIGGLAAPLVKAAANAQALTAQFDQVFGDLKNSATTSLNSIAKETGILPERLKGSFTMMAAFAKTTGADTAEALDLTNRATLAAADSAAFYDKSIEEVTESLQSYLKGNYENDSALGISSTETTRNAAANKLYGKSFNDLSEAQKQLTLLQMVEDGNKLSGALGQASRESDSLENQVGNLKQAWENLKVLLGGPILEPAIQGIKLLTKIIQGFNPEPFISAFKGIKTGVTPVIDSIKTYVQTGLKILKAFWDEHGASIITTVKTAFTKVVTTIQSVLGSVVSFIQSQLTTIQQFWNEHGQSILERVIQTFNAVLDVIKPILSDAVAFIVSTWGKIKEFYDENGAQILEAVSNVFKGIMAVIEFIMPAVKLVIDIVWGAIKQVITGSLDVIMGAVKIFSGLFTGDFSKMWEGIKQLFWGAIDVIVGWMTLSFVGGLKTLLTNFAKAGWNILKGMWDDIAKVFTSMGSKVSGFVSEMATKVVSYFTNLFNSGKSIFTNLRTTGESIWNALKQTVVKLAKSIWDEVVTKFNGLLNSVKSIMATVKTAISDLWTKAVDFIKNGINLYQVGIDVVQGLINGIGSMATKVWDSAKNLATKVIESIKGTLDTHSPSRITYQIGIWTGQGLANGIDDTQSLVQSSMEDLGGVLLDVTDHYKSEEKKITDKSNAEITQIEKRSKEDIDKIYRAAAAKKRKTTQDEKLKIIRIQEDAAKKIADIEKKARKDSYDLITKEQQDKLKEIKLFIEDKKSLNELSLEDEIKIWEQALDHFDMYSKERVEVQKALKKATEDLNKENLAQIKQYISDKKSLDQLSLMDEVKIWENAINIFEEGSKERVEAQNNHKKAVEAVNKEITSINKEYLEQMKKIDEDYVKEAERINKEYEDAFGNRVSALMSFAGTFDAFKIELNRTGQELMDNLQSQVDGFKNWQDEFAKLSERGIDSDLLKELSNLGVKALPELAALNSMTDEQLSQYSALYKEKSQLAREQATEELAGMRKDTDARLLELRQTADAQLSKLQTEWDLKIKNLVRATDSELATLKQVGVNAGQGLLDGLASMEGPLISKAQAIADAIKSTIEAALDIHSPSRWMRDYVAGNIAKGFVIGVDRNKGLITKASDRLGEMIKPNGIVNKLRGVSANLGLVGAKSLQQVQNSTNTNHINNSRTIHNNYTLQSEDEIAKYERYKRRMQFELGLV